uniref:Uncharacterized protein n=1 Tax=Moniliophthora roreri TaxID=221103 RepID=A0A0W0FJN8_MONRR
MVSGICDYQLWFPDWGSYLLPTSLNNSTRECTKVANRSWTDGSPQCNPVLDCILKDTPERGKRMLSTSLVLLGVTPTMLLSFGMSVAEAVMLSLEPPPLSTPLSFGSVAICPSRINPILPFPNTSNLLDLAPLTRQPKYRWLIRLIEYAVVLGVVANAFHMSLYLGWRASSSWDCDSAHFPLLRVLLPWIIHIIGVISFLMSSKAISQSARFTSGQQTLVLSRDSAQELKFRVLKSGARTLYILYT